MATKIFSKSRLAMCYWFFCVFTVLCLSGVAAWLSLIPKNPIFAISNAHFPAMNIKNQSHCHNLSVPLQNNSIIFDIVVFNPNKRMGIYYSAIVLELLYGGGGAVVGTNSTPDFYQGYKSTTMLRIPVHAGRGFWRGVNDGDVGFMVRVKTDVKFWVIRWKTKVHKVVYEAIFSKVKINLNGSVLGGNYAEMRTGSRVKFGN